MATREVAAATHEMAATSASGVTAAPEVALGKRGNRRGGHGSAEQQGREPPKKSPVRRTQSSSPLCCRIFPTRAIGLDAPRAPLFKLTHIKTH